MLGAFADDRRNSSFALMSQADTDYALSYPENGAVTEGESGGAPPGSAISIDNQRVLGATSAIVEFSDGPAAVAVVTIGDSVIAGRHVFEQSSRRLARTRWIDPRGRDSDAASVQSVC